MSMTAAEIAGVVGTERKAWWPGLVEYDAEATCWLEQGVGIDPDTAELAFIGAAVRELAKRGSVMLAPAVNKTKGTEGWVCLSKRNPIRGGPTTLHALVAALNESEGA